MESNTNWVNFKQEWFRVDKLKRAVAAAVVVIVVRKWERIELGYGSMIVSGFHLTV